MAEVCNCWRNERYLMFKSLRRGLLATAATTLVLGSAAVLASSANATTVVCQNGFGDQCSTFGGKNLQSPTPSSVFWDVKGTTAAPNVPVIGYGANGNDKATDFVKVLHFGAMSGLPGSNSSTKSYSFVYTPNGHWSNLCVADANQIGGHVLTLRTCNGGPYQRFVAEQVNSGNSPSTFDGSSFNGDRIRDSGNWPNSFALMNVAFGLYVQDTSPASPFGPAATPDTRQLRDSSVVGNLADNQVWAWQS